MAAFETKTCGRCGGSGHYSFCQRYGTTCFGCGGKKVVLTKRGAEANRYCRELRTVLATEVKVGDVIEVGSITHGGDPFSYYAKVVAVAPGEPTRYSSDGGVTWQEAATLLFEVESKRFGKSGYSTGPESRIYRRGTKEERLATLAQAMAYQATLNERGTVRKRPELTPEQKAARAAKAAVRKEAKRVAKAAAWAEKEAAAEAALTKPEVEAALAAWVREEAPTWLPETERTMLAYVRWLRNHGHRGKAAVVVLEAAAKVGAEKTA